MAHGSPNTDKQLNFETFVYDPNLKNSDGTTGGYVPIYVAPDATDTVAGNVLLSDDIPTNSSEEQYYNAATGVTASTPKAAKRIWDNAETKLSKTTTTLQTVASKVNFNDKATIKSMEVLNAATFDGDVTVGGSIEIKKMSDSEVTTLLNTCFS